MNCSYAFGATLNYEATLQPQLIITYLLLSKPDLFVDFAVLPLPMDCGSTIALRLWLSFCYRFWR